MKPLVDKKYLLEKFNVKGSWTFARIPDVAPDKAVQFGWIKVKGSIDGYQVKKLRLMPMGDGKLFLPVREEIRRKIGKHVGDKVHILLYPDEEPLEIPDELVICLEDEPKALGFFKKLSESEQQFYIHWIFSAKKEETKTRRMAKTIDRLLKGLKLYDKEI